MSKPREKVEIPAAPQARKAVARVHDLLRSMLGTAEGRELAAWLVIDLCGARNRLMSTIGDHGTTAYGAGKRDVGLELEEHIELADGAGWVRALDERRALLLRKADAQDKERAKKAQETEA